ncbi:MAG: hypothetical protein RQ866_05940 [Bacteroidales bacterium]|nr:hypothetical protein [Bacteroidales bacterium]
MRKFAAGVLMIMTIFITVLAILAIWDIIEVKNILTKALGTLLIIFSSSAVILFIFSLIFKDK